MVAHLKNFIKFELVSNLIKRSYSLSAGLQYRAPLRQIADFCPRLFSCQCCMTNTFSSRDFINSLQNGFWKIRPIWMECNLEKRQGWTMIACCLIASRQVVQTSKHKKEITDEVCLRKKSFYETAALSQDWWVYQISPSSNCIRKVTQQIILLVQKP